MDTVEWTTTVAAAQREIPFHFAVLVSAFKEIIFPNSVPSSQKARSVSIEETSQKLLREVISLFFKSCEKHMINTYYGKSSVFLCLSR